MQDCYQLILELEKAAERSCNGRVSNEIALALKRYHLIRINCVRAGVIRDGHLANGGQGQG